MAIIKLTNQNYEKTVSENPTLLIDFYADWCGPCRMVGPIIEQLADERTDLAVAKVNVDDNQELSAKFGVVSIPTIVLLKNGELVAKNVGYKPKDELLRTLGL